MKRIFATIAGALIIGGCAVVAPATHMADKVNKLQLGMTMKEVTSVMGKSYDTLTARDGYRVIEYTGLDGSKYHLYMEREVLTGWDKVLLPEKPQPRHDHR